MENFTRKKTCLLQKSVEHLLEFYTQLWVSRIHIDPIIVFLLIEYLFETTSEKNDLLK